MAKQRQSALNNETASPQLENGYTRIANELLEAISRTRLSPNENRVLLAVIRETYGYQEKHRPVSAGGIAKLTGIQRHNVWRALQALERKEIISRLGTAKSLGYENVKGKKKIDHRSIVWSLQKDYLRWVGIAPDTNISIGTETNMGIGAETNLDVHKERERKGKKGGGKSPPQKKGKTLPPSEKKRKTKRDARLDHPALKIYRELAHLWPEHAVRDEMVASCEEVGEDRWRWAIQEWIGRGYNKRNMKGICDVARNGFRDEAGGGLSTEEHLALLPDLMKR